MKMKYLLIIFLIFILSCSNSKNGNNSNNRVEIILSGEDNNIEITNENLSHVKDDVKSNNIDQSNDDNQK